MPFRCPARPVRKGVPGPEGYTDTIARHRERHAGAAARAGLLRKCGRHPLLARGRWHARFPSGSGSQRRRWHVTASDDGQATRYLWQDADIEQPDCGGGHRRPVVSLTGRARPDGRPGGGGDRSGTLRTIKRRSTVAAGVRSLSLAVAVVGTHPHGALAARPVREPAQVPPRRPHPSGTGDVGVLQGTGPERAGEPWHGRTFSPLMRPRAARVHRLAGPHSRPSR